MQSGAAQLDGAAGAAASTARSHPQRWRAPLSALCIVIAAILAPLGLVFIPLGYPGVSQTPFQLEQNSYIMSGGIFGAVGTTDAVLAALPAPVPHLVPSLPQEA